ncbi:hypothetical protein [Chengkuizengella marina]|uniref:DUF4825 domain-containing protein n=1 Tax=Chengkuizengella marina TaxID=2507566 RepID=A0A6N9PZD9_9BACL|nr:hypothetical protein [Chengkuizengella marina]NBI28246.1 hypothetical protein [Chengkuizengella marina]
MKKIILTFLFVIIMISSTSCSNNINPEDLFFTQTGWTETDTKRIFWLGILPNESLGITETPGIDSVIPYDINPLNEEEFEFKTVSSEYDRTPPFFLNSEDIGLPSKINVEDNYVFVFITDKNKDINIDQYMLTLNNKFKGIEELTYITNSFE